MAARSVRGSREAPIVTVPETVPSGCYWWVDPDGELCLMPGCMARVQDGPEAECTCDKLAARLETAQQRLRDKEEREEYANTWWFALRQAVEAHPDRSVILADARRRAGR